MLPLSKCFLGPMDPLGPIVRPALPMGIRGPIWATQCHLFCIRVVGSKEGVQAPWNIGPDADVTPFLCYCPDFTVMIFFCLITLSGILNIFVFALQ